MKSETRNQFLPTCVALSASTRLQKRFSISNSSIRLLIPIALVFFAVQAFAAWDDWHTGYATPTTTGYTNGAALLDPISSDMEITALNYTDYNYNGVDAGLAGAYLQVYGTNGNSTVVYVTDTYPEAPAGALDLCFKSFSKIGDLSAGNINIQWRVVKGPVSGNFSYRIKDGTNPNWAAIQVRNHKYPVMKMEYYQNGGWTNMVKQGYNHFVGQNMGSDSIQVRITDIRGVSVTDTIQGLPANGTYATNAYIVQGNVQFPDDQGTTSAGGTYKLLARHSGQALDANNNGTANGTQIIQWPYTGGANQQWTISSVGTNLYSIIGVQSGKCIDISGAGTANGTTVQLWDYVGGSNQKFAFNPTTNGYYEVSPSHATGSCLDLYYASTTNGAAVKLCQWNGGNNQQWLVQPVDGTYKLISQNSGLAMETYGQHDGNGEQINQWSYYGGGNQQWKLTATNGYYKIIGVESGRSLDIYNGGTTNDTKVELWDYHNGTMQQFKLTSTVVGQFRITPNNAPGSCLDVSGISTANGASVHLWQWLNAANQKWSFQKP